MLTIIIWAAIIAVVAYVYREVLAYEPVLNWWFKFGLKYENKWFHAPIWGVNCASLVKMPFWIYIFNWLSSNLDKNAPFWCFVFFLIPKYGNIDYSVYFGVFSVSLSILFTLLLTKYLKK